jgi:hypothetical protein
MSKPMVKNSLCPVSQARTPLFQQCAHNWILSFQRKHGPNISGITYYPKLKGIDYRALPT